ncbi:MAG: hypothetical protein Q7U54_19215 [Bacteroidales bacterium]|nr:hypothetical protein [Bacteroidales bacterium]
MLRTNNKTSLTIREIEYSIRIRDKETSFTELRDLLRSELTKFSANSGRIRHEASNPIQEFLRSNIERSIIKGDSTQIYFINYREKEGSLRIVFTLLVITDNINFAPTRQALDYLVKDTIVDYFEEILERHIPVNISVQANDKEIANFADSATSTKHSQRPGRDFLTRAFAIVALAISMGLGGAFAYKMLNSNTQNENAKLKEDYINLLLEKKIIEAVKDQKFTINLYKIADTTGSNHNPSVSPKSK